MLSKALRSRGAAALGGLLFPGLGLGAATGAAGIGLGAAAGAAGLASGLALVAGATALCVGAGAAGLASSAAAMTGATALGVGAAGVGVGAGAAGLASALALGAGATALGPGAFGVLAAGQYAFGAGLLAAGAIGLGSSLCLMASMGACVGYFAGGLGGSTLTHLDWNERTARAGAFLGGAAQVLGIAGAWGFYVAGPAFTSFLNGGSWLASALNATPFYGLPGVTVLDMVGTVGVGLSAISLLQGDYEAAGYGAIDLGLKAYYGTGNPVPYFAAKWLYNSVSGQYNGML